MYRRLQNPQIASVIVCSKWDRMVYNTVLTAEKRGPQIVGAQIAGVYCIKRKFQYPNYDPIAKGRLVVVRKVVFEGILLF